MICNVLDINYRYIKQLSSNLIFKKQRYRQHAKTAHYC